MSIACHIDDTVICHAYLMKLIRLAAHVWVAILLGLCFPILSDVVRRRLIRWWCSRLLHIFHIQLTIDNPNQVDLSNRYLVVANHISWIDIHVLNAISPLTFVAKSEVGAWPIFGYLARQIGTLFIVRERPSDIKRVLAEMVQQLNVASVCIFPEGTSSDGRSLLPFKTNLFQAASDGHAKVLPVLIRFTENDHYSDAPAFIGDMTLIDSIKRIASCQNLRATVYLFNPIEESGDRRHLCDQAHSTIRERLEQFEHN